MKKILMISAVLLAICLTVSAVSADNEWSFSFFSSDSSNSDGGQMSFENGKLKLQDFQFAIPDGYNENESARKLAVDVNDTPDAKASMCQFIKDGKDIFIKVYFFPDDSDKELTITPGTAEVEKKISNIDGYYSDNKYNDSTPTFRYIKDGKLVEVNAPDDDTLTSIIK